MYLITGYATTLKQHMTCKWLQGAPDVRDQTSQLYTSYIVRFERVHMGYPVTTYLAPAQPGKIFDNEDISFVFAKQGLNIELIDMDKRAQRINVEGL